MTEQLAMNDIPNRQNSERALWLMRARQRTYALATLLQIIQLGVSVVLPAICAWIALSQPGSRAPLAATSLLLLLIDIFLLDNFQAVLLRRAAKFGELFDCEVLDLPWNGFIAGAKPDREDIEAAASAYPRTPAALAVIRDWYPPVGRAPIHIARVVCQLANMRYDAKLRLRYATALWTFGGVTLLAGFVGWATSSLTLDQIVLSLFVPATPIIVWSFREAFRQRSAAAAQQRIKGAVDALWDKIATDNAEAGRRRAREFQDAIYQRRVSSPLIFPLVYHVLRDKMESQMNKGAEERLREAGYPSEADT
jgi:hypothetical protein